MADVKKWSVTYTKHMKQKRKVYQDGFLELHKTANKLLLYDDGEKLLECRILKKDEVIGCGETLTFNAFLVDVNGAEGDHEEPPAPSSNSIGRDNRNQTAKINKSQRLTLSPSHKIIRDFKKRELLKYEVMQSKYPDSTKPTLTEWEVLYTTQITQKAKKYHDGFLQLSISGSIGRQIMLLDTSRNALESRFLKKDEKIESGARVAFDGHLVDIRELRGDNKSFGENTSNIKRENGVMYRQKSCAYKKNTLQQESIKSEFQNDGASQRSQDMAEPNETEWQVLYTTQLTQKSKKYHDGFLKLAMCGSHGRQAMLYDETRTLLSTRFLKKEQVLRSGVSLEFDAYLIDIGEPQTKNETTAVFNPRGNNCNVAKEIGEMHKQQSSLTSNDYVLKGKSLANKDAKSRFNISNMSQKEASREEDPINKRLRNARQILSILQRPRMEKSMVAGYRNNKVTPVKGPLLVSNAVDLDVPEDDQPPKSSVPHDQSIKNVDSRESRDSKDLERSSDTTSSKAISNDSGSQSTKDINNGNSHQQPYSENTQVNARYEGANASNTSSSPATACGPVDNQMNPSDELTCATEMDEYPSFDLGF